MQKFILLIVIVLIIGALLLFRQRSGNQTSQGSGDLVMQLYGPGRYGFTYAPFWSQRYNNTTYAAIADTIIQKLVTLRAQKPVEFTSSSTEKLSLNQIAKQAVTVQAIGGKQITHIVFTEPGVAIISLFVPPPTQPALLEGKIPIPPEELQKQQHLVAVGHVGEMQIEFKLYGVRPDLQKDVLNILKHNGFVSN